MATMTSEYYYCHRCNTQVTLTQDGKCDQCQEGFIEKIESDQSYETEVDFMQIINGPRQSSDGSDNSFVFPNSRDLRLPIDNILQSLFGGVFMDIQSNSSDYVFTDESFDNIVTRIMNQFEQSGPPPATKEDIDQLPLIPKENADDTCSICLCDYEKHDNINMLPCQHNYHAECIKSWLSRHGTCPVCRKDLSGNDTRLDEAVHTSSPEETSPSSGGQVVTAATPAVASFQESSPAHLSSANSAQSSTTNRTTASAQQSTEKKNNSNVHNIL